MHSYLFDSWYWERGEERRVMTAIGAYLLQILRKVDLMELNCQWCRSCRCKGIQPPAVVIHSVESEIKPSQKGDLCVSQSSMQGFDFLIPLNCPSLVVTKVVGSYDFLPMILCHRS